MKTYFRLRLMIAAVLISLWMCNVSANLTADITDINSLTGSASVTVSFPNAVSGDLYLAALAGGQLYFVSNTGDFSTKAVAFISNSNYSNSFHVMDVSSNGIPAGTYSLYEVVVKTGGDPMDVNNWVGGLAGLSELKFNINSLSTTTATASTSSASSTTTGKSLYTSLTCANGSCHGSNPALNKNHVLQATSLSKLKQAISVNPNEMGYLSATSDANLQAVVDYLAAF